MNPKEVPTGIAIIGMACRFPGATNIDEFWNNLIAGKESITFFSDTELLDAGVQSEELEKSGYVKASAVLENVYDFDATFFGYSPREIRLIDPQQRLFLETAWEAFENAGYHPETCKGPVGVYAGSGGIMTSYLMAHQSANPELLGVTGSLQHLGNDKDFLATRVAYKLNLAGPAITVQTACSTSLVALNLACRSILDGECHMALAGAAVVRFPHKSGYISVKGDILSPDGHCRAFDADAQGTIFGSGVGAVLLKHLEDAIADRDHIYAVIKGTAVNNDGGEKISYTASSVLGQSKAMLEAMVLAGVSASDIQYVECHGTGTAIGDPLEIKALTRAFTAETDRKNICAVGSVKTNVGHLEQAAGIASLIKTALSISREKIPPSLNFNNPNPKIDFPTSSFFVNTTLREWPRNSCPRYAAVNALGLGGTNAFVVLKEAPPPTKETIEETMEMDRPSHILCLSAKNEAALSQIAQNFIRHIDRSPGNSIGDLCYTANSSRTFFNERLSVIAPTLEGLKQKLESILENSEKNTAIWRGHKEPIVFLFSGQGAQYPGMTEELYRSQPVFRQKIELCDSLLRPYMDKPLLEILYSRKQTATDLEDVGEFIHQTIYTQPALVAVEYALAELWSSWGIKPHAVMGHSIGEITAACVAGVLKLEDALRLAALRGKCMQSLPRNGGMAVVFTTVDIVNQLLHNEQEFLSVAGLNSSGNTVVSGEKEVLISWLEKIEEKGITYKKLEVSHAFHSSLMNPILDELEAIASAITFATPTIKLVSNLNGQLMTQAPDAAYWRNHARQAVRFADGMNTLQGMGYKIFLEVGPGKGLISIGRQCVTGSENLWLASIDRKKDDWFELLNSLKSLYLSGLYIDWNSFDSPYERSRVPLPSYPFMRKPYRLSSTTITSPLTSVTSSAVVRPLPGMRLRTSLKEQLYHSYYSVEAFPYLDHHRIYGMVVLPTTAGLTAALQAGKEYFHDAELQLQNLVYKEALVFLEDESRLLQFIIKPESREKVVFELLSSSMSGDDDWRNHMQGELVKQTNASEELNNNAFDANKVKKRCASEIPVDMYYSFIRKTGLVYGPLFRGIDKLWIGDGESLSRVSQHKELSQENGSYHPAFLDACLHIYPTLVKEYGNFSAIDAAPSITFLPTGVERFRVFKENITAVWVHATVRNRGTGPNLLIDIHIYDDNNQPVSFIEGLSLKKLPAEALQPISDDIDKWLYQLHGEQLPELPPLDSIFTPHLQDTDKKTTLQKSVWIIFADRGGLAKTLAEHLEEMGMNCRLVFPGNGRIDTEKGLSTINPQNPDEFINFLDDLYTSGISSVNHVLYLWGMDVQPMTQMTFPILEELERNVLGGLLYLVRALVETKTRMGFSPRLSIITGKTWVQHVDGDVSEFSGKFAEHPIQGALWGMGRVIGLEYPQMFCKLIELAGLPGDSLSQRAGVVIREVLYEDSESQVLHSNGKRFGTRLVRLPEMANQGIKNAPDSAALAINPKSTFLITGGLGFLGLQVAQWLVERLGVRHLALTSRQEPSNKARVTIAALEKQGVRVLVLKGDISVEADVIRILDQLDKTMPPLTGVIHSAGILDDGVIAQMDWQKFSNVTSAKLKGGWLLHHYTRDKELTHFILFSSILSLTGSAGQINYVAGNAFLDSLVQYRRSKGLPATAINWGPWAEAGLATASGNRGEAIWKSRGTRYIPLEKGISILEKLVYGHVDHAAVTITDWSVFLSQFMEDPRFYSQLAKETSTPKKKKQSVGDVKQFRSLLEQTPPLQQRELLNGFIAKQVASILELDELPTPQQPLGELGLDSLLSVQLANLLETGLGVPVTIATLLQGGSIEYLIEILFPHLEKGEVETASIDKKGISTASSKGWLVFPRPNPQATIRLFCFPFTGGGSAVFRPWGDLLATDIELVAVEPPGRLGRLNEQPVNNLEIFLEQLLVDLLPFLDKPFAFFGHCLGGLTMFETAKRLIKNHGLAPRHLFVSGARPPHMLSIENDFEEHLAKGLADKEAFNLFLPAHKQDDDIFAEIIRHFNIDATSQFLEDPQLRGLMLPVIRAEFQMAYDYRFEGGASWDIPITCFAGLDDRYAAKEHILGWGQFTNADFKIYSRAGAHFQVVEDRDFIIGKINEELMK